MYNFDMEIFKVFLTVASIVITLFFSTRALNKQNTENRAKEEANLASLTMQMKFILSEINEIKIETKDIYREVRDSTKQSSMNEQKIKEIFYRLDQIDERVSRIEQGVFKTPRVEMKGD